MRNRIQTQKVNQYKLLIQANYLHADVIQYLSKIPSVSTTKGRGAFSIVGKAALAESQ